MDAISKIQQMLDESRFVDAQKDAELLLIKGDVVLRHPLIDLYLRSLKAQAK